MDYNDKKEHACTNANPNAVSNNIFGSNLEHSGGHAFRDDSDQPNHNCTNEANELNSNSKDGDFEQTNMDNDATEFVINSVVDEILEQQESYDNLQDDNNCTTIGDVTFNDEVEATILLKTNPSISQHQPPQKTDGGSFQIQTTETLTSQTPVAAGVTVDCVLDTMNDKADATVHVAAETDVTLSKNPQLSFPRMSNQVNDLEGDGILTTVETLHVQIPMESETFKESSLQLRKETILEDSDPNLNDTSGNDLAVAYLETTIPQGDGVVNEGIELAIKNEDDDANLIASNKQESSHDKSPVRLPETFSKTEKNTNADSRRRISSIGTQMAQDYIDFATNFMLQPLSSQPKSLLSAFHSKSIQDNDNNAIQSSASAYCGSSSGFYYGFQTDGTHYPLEAISVLGYLKSPFRRPTVLERWSPYEITLFEGSIALYGKDFRKIANEIIRTKSTMQVIEFYYVWKKTTHYRQWKKSYVPPNMQEDDDSETENNCTTVVDRTNNRKRKNITEEYQSDNFQSNKRKDKDNNQT